MLIQVSIVKISGIITGIIYHFQKYFSSPLINSSFCTIGFVQYTKGKTKNDAICSPVKEKGNSAQAYVPDQSFQQHI